MTDVTFRPASAPRSTWCWLCRQAIVFGDIDARRVETESGEEWVCGRCWTKNSPTVPVDYMREDDDGPR